MSARKNTNVAGISAVKISISDRNAIVLREIAPFSSATNADTHEHIPPDESDTISPYSGNAAK